MDQCNVMNELGVVSMVVVLVVVEYYAFVFNRPAAPFECCCIESCIIKIGDNP